MRGVKTLVRSMTGFGRGIASSDTFHISVEARSVNHRFLEISVKYPRELIELESTLKKHISNYVSRGKLDVYVSFKNTQGAMKQVQLNEPLFHAYEQVKQSIANKGSITTNWTMAELLAIDQMLIEEEQQLPMEEIHQLLLDALSNAMDQLIFMRSQEGQALENVLLQLVEQLQKQIAIIETYRYDAVDKYRERLKTRLQEFTTIDLVDEKIRLEVAMLAEKIDISEELDRLNSHIDQMFDTIKSHGTIGRKLEFIVQEMHREMNTIGSKNQSAACSSAIVEGKMILEKMREQVQNIE